jgi:hypothetical protein
VGLEPSTSTCLARGPQLSYTPRPTIVIVIIIIIIIIKTPNKSNQPVKQTQHFCNLCLYKPSTCGRGTGPEHMGAKLGRVLLSDGLRRVEPCVPVLSCSLASHPILGGFPSPTGAYSSSLVTSLLACHLPPLKGSRILCDLPSSPAQVLCTSCLSFRAASGCKTTRGHSASSHDTQHTVLSLSLGQTYNKEHHPQCDQRVASTESAGHMPWTI